MRKVCSKIKLIYNRVRSTLEKNEIFQKSPLTRTEYMVLSYVSYSDERLCLKDVQNKFNITRSTTSELLTSLENKGFVTKEQDEKDSRIKYIIVTASGKREHKKIKQHFECIENELLACLTAEEADQFDYLLDKVIENFKKGECDEKVCCCKNKK